MKRLFLGLVPILFFVCFVSAFAQKTVSGRIISADDGAPLRGARVVAKGTKVGAFSDARGQYKITLPEGATALVFNSVGYVPTEITVGDRTTLDVRLELDAKSLDDVVVTAFGVKQEKKALGYSVQEIGSREIMQTNQPNIVAGLQGRVAGVTISGSGGGVGAGAQIIIRGISSLSPGANNQPLFVVDGIPISNDTQAGNVLPTAGSNAANSNEQFAFTNRAADINPDDIESMNILKGPAATALYGLRAANGVVIINTKKGSSGKTLVQFTSNATYEEVGKTPSVQSKWGQGGGADTSARRTDFWSYGIPRSMNSNDPFFDNYRNLFRPALRFDQQLSVSGGTNTTRFYTSVSRMDQTGIVPGTDMQRTTISLRGTNDVDENFSVGASVNYTNSFATMPAGGDRSIFSALNFWIPSYDVNDASIAAAPVGQRTTDPYQPIRTLDGRNTNIVYNDGVIDNPLFYALTSPLTSSVNRLFGDVKFDYRPFPWLRGVYQLTLDYFNDSRRRTVTPEVGPGQTVNGFITEESLNRRELNSQLLITASGTLAEDLEGSITLGNAITDIENSGLRGYGEGFVLPNFYDLSNTTRFNAGRNYSLQRLIGVFADAKLSYKNMLFLNITGRNDWSSTLPIQNRSFFYPAASASFVFSELMKGGETSWLTLGKIRASWAQVGKDAAGAYRIGEYFSAIPNFPVADRSGFRLSIQNGSLNLRPETTTGIEFGVEAKMFDNRLGLDVAYFIQESRDQIVTLPVSNSTGFSTFLLNGGSIRNSGIEVLLTATPILEKDFSWDITLNWSRLRGEITSISDGINEILITQDPAGTIISKMVRPTNTNPTPRVGDLYGYDFIRNAQGQALIGADGYPTVNQTQQVLVGNALPDWQGGITNTLRLGGLSLSFLVEFRQGGSVVDMSERNRARNGISAWTEPRYQNIVFNGVNAQGEPNTQPVLWNAAAINTTNLLYRSDARTILAHQFNLQDASWIRLRNVSLGYTLTKAALGEDSFFQNIRFTLTGNNLLLTTPFRGFDPDNIGFSADFNGLGFVGRNTPATRSYAFGISLTF
jgi:TonB-linked SusC/RagA family outer membrane protein